MTHRRPEPAARALTAASLAAGLIGLSGCIISTDIGGTKYARARTEVSSERMDRLIASHNDVRLGQHKDAVLSKYPADTLALKSSMKQDGAVVEEWRADAVSRNGDVYFRRYLYFMDDQLVEVSDDRIDYRDKPEIVSGWTSD